ncbi:hypothetical protein ACTHO0_06210 [Cytobacillus praedii]
MTGSALLLCFMNLLPESDWQPFMWILDLHKKKNHSVEDDEDTK